MILKFLGVKTQFEVLVVIIISLLKHLVDDSYNALYDNIGEVWSFKFGGNLRNSYDESLFKHILTGVILSRAFTLHIFIVAHLILLWPAIFNKRLYLFVPWLIIGFFRSIILNMVTLITATFICIGEKGYDGICVEVILAQLITHGPSVYAWLSIFRYFNGIKCEKGNNKGKYIYMPQLLESLEDDRNVITESTIANFANHIRKLKHLRSSSRSLDALLKLESSSKMFKDIADAKDEGRSLPERAMAILDVVANDIERARLEKTERSRGNWNIENRLNSDNKRYQINKLDGKCACTCDLTDVYEETAKEIELKCVSLDSKTSCSKNEDDADVADKHEEDLR